MKWHYASLSDYPKTAHVCLVETPEAYRIMWYSKIDERWYSDADKRYSDDDSNNCFKWVYLEDIFEKLNEYESWFATKDGKETDNEKNGMTEWEALELLQQHNRWRRGDDSIEMANPTAIGLAIDEACRVLAEHIQEKEKTNGSSHDR